MGIVGIVGIVRIGYYYYYIPVVMLAEVDQALCYVAITMSTVYRGLYRGWNGMG